MVTAVPRHGKAERIGGAFPAEIQTGVAVQLADCLVGVACQRLRFFPERNIRAPVCGVLIARQPVKAMVRQGQFFKLQERRSRTTPPTRTSAGSSPSSSGEASEARVDIGSVNLRKRVLAAPEGDLLGENRTDSMGR
jgi:hypothetical protein